MNALILLGAPGSGKGTIAEKIRDKCNLSHVSTGDMLRAAVKNGTETGKKADAYMKKGELVPDDIIVGIVEDRFDNGKKDEYYMFDGFPRTVNQAELLQKGLTKRNSKITAVFLLDTPRQVLIERLTGRRVCKKCGQSYHIKNIPPKKAGICDLCGGELYQRADDCEATIINRLEVFTKQTESLVEFYKKQGLLVTVNSNQNADKVAAEMTQAINARKNS